MKRTLTILILTLLSIVALSSYVTGSGMRGSYNPRTGDTSLDATLGDLNIQAQGDNLSDFISSLSLSYKIPKIEIENLIFKIKMSPADAFMTVGLASIIKKPLGRVVKEYQANKGKGWGVIAKGLGIKPGSKEFKALKDGGIAQLGKVKNKGKDKGRSKGDKKSDKKKNNKKKK